MGKARSFISHRLAMVGLRLAIRLGIVDKVANSSPDLLRSVLSSKISQASDESLDQMIADCEKEDFGNEYVACAYRILKEQGVDTLQELKNEKFLREHGKKHG